MTEHKRITGRELIHKILDHPAWLDLPVHVLVMDDGLDGGFLNTVEADRFELDGPDVLSLISEKPAVGHEPGREARRCTITVGGNRCKISRSSEIRYQSQRLRSCNPKTRSPK